jgi:hypothetical protein
LPGIECQPEGATSCRVFLPATPISVFIRLIAVWPLTSTVLSYSLISASTSVVLGFGFGIENQ